MNNLIFVFFYSVLHFSGFTIFTKFLNSSKIEFQENNKLYSSFYPLISLFFIGNMNLILNFFTPLKKVAIFVVTIFLKIGKIFLKRTDLHHDSSHKPVNAFCSVLLAKYLGFKRIKTETGASMNARAVASALVMI